MQLHHFRSGAISPAKNAAQQLTITLHTQRSADPSTHWEEEGKKEEEERGIREEEQCDAWDAVWHLHLIDEN